MGDSWVGEAKTTEIIDDSSKALVKYNDLTKT